ncbi:MAG: triose-phosphate isomerase [Bacteroidota bacterium]
MENSKRKKIVAGNWKMNKDYNEGRDLVKQIVEGVSSNDTLVIICPPYIHLYNTYNKLNDISNIRLGAQNCHHEESGAYTGEVSAAMIKSTGAEYVILGHSERREYFNETDELISAKIKKALSHGLSPIYCCGEKLDIREANEHEAFVENQIKTALFTLTAEEFSKVVIAYEPVWAIGTGKTATPEQAQEMHQHIRQLIANHYDATVADATSILYGGSCKPHNAESLFSQPDVDGGLIGGASLKANDFMAIVDSFPK